MAEEAPKQVQAMTLVEAFEKAWQSVQGDNFSHEMARLSLEASVDGVPELETALARMRA
jgi:hypothetical protein